MNGWVLLGAAFLLALERCCYAWVAAHPEAFCAWCRNPGVARAGQPIEVLQKLFYGFKALQGVVFLGWCYVHGEGALVPLHGGPVALAIGGVLLVIGQSLNFSVLYRLGRIGVFYGQQLGYAVPWCQEFPFSLCKHPQYVGTVLSIWGFFLLMRFPYDDWYVLPVLETVYYAVGAYFEP